MAENTYEGMFLVDSGQYNSNPDGTTNEITEILEKAGATIVANRPWQDGKLAYPVDGHRKGVHFLTFFKMGGGGVTELNRACRLSGVVLRHLVIKHPPSLFDAMVDALQGHESTGEETEEAAAEEATKKAETEAVAAEG